MKVCGVIAEYNPFHNGHFWQIKQIRERLKPDVLIVVMSGNFVQRGDFAVIDKWQRTKMALKASVDLVVELPIYGAVQPADIFSYEAIKILTNLGVTDLVFSTENNQLDYLKTGREINQILQDSKYFTDYRNTYATQFNKLLNDKIGVQISQPNQLLGLSYAQIIDKYHLNMNLIALKRQSSRHDQKELSGKISSASAIRAAIRAKQDITKTVPDFVLDLLNDGNLTDWNQYFLYLKYQLLTISLDDLSSIYQISEGLQFKLKQEIMNSYNLHEYLSRIKSKRYTYSRLRRICLYVLLHITQDDMQNMRANPYIHILGFNQTGQNYLRIAKKMSQLPLVTKISKKDGNRTGIIAREVQIDNILDLTGVTKQNFGRQPVFFKVGE